MPLDASANDSALPAALRGHMIQLTLDQLESLNPSTAVAIRARVGTDVLQRISSAPRVEWLPISLQIAVNDALFAELSATEYAEFWRRTGLASAQSSLFNRFVQGAMRLFGVSPGAIYKMLPRANTHVTRGIGDYLVTPTPHESHVTLEWTSIPKELRGSASWLASSKATMATPLDMLGLNGSVEVDDAQFELGRVVYSIRWG